MNRLYLRIVLLLLAVAFLGACASTNEDVASDTPVKTGGTVPGEKTGDEGGVSATAGPGAAGAGVRW